MIKIENFTIEEMRMIEDIQLSHPNRPVIKWGDDYIIGDEHQTAIQLAVALQKKYKSDDFQLSDDPTLIKVERRRSRFLSVRKVRIARVVLDSINSAKVYMNPGHQERKQLPKGKNTGYPFGDKSMMTNLHI